MHPPARDGLLVPDLAQRVNGLPLPALPLSPAAHALLRTEAYVLLRDQPECSDRDLIAALNELAHDAVVALRLPPAGAVLPHHLTIQGNLGQDSKTLSLIHLAATPITMEQRAGQAQGDERPFIMSGGGVLDDMCGRGRLTGPRTGLMAFCWR